MTIEQSGAVRWSFDGMEPLTLTNDVGTLGFGASVAGKAFSLKGFVNAILELLQLTGKFIRRALGLAILLCQISKSVALRQFDCSSRGHIRGPLESVPAPKRAFLGHQSLARL